MLQGIQMKEKMYQYQTKISDEAMQKLIWAKSKALHEYKKGMLEQPTKSHSEEIIWMYNKIQELSKVLKTKIDKDNAINTKTKKKKEEDKKNVKKTIKSPEGNSLDYH